MPEAETIVFLGLKIPTLVVLVKHCTLLNLDLPLSVLSCPVMSCPVPCIWFERSNQIKFKKLLKEMITFLSVAAVSSRVFENRSAVSLKEDDSSQPMKICLHIKMKALLIFSALY
jgi:hypothetical protein